MFNKSVGYSFECQHGEDECLGNMYHACAVEKIKDQELRLNIIKCKSRKSDYSKLQPC